MPFKIINSVSIFSILSKMVKTTAPSYTAQPHPSCLWEESIQYEGDMKSEQ
jgi:hypothetical protein